MEHREQYNELTHYMDLSQVYGSTVPEAIRLMGDETGLNGKNQMSNHDALSKFVFIGEFFYF